MNLLDEIFIVNTYYYFYLHITVCIYLWLLLLPSSLELMLNHPKLQFMIFDRPTRISHRSNMIPTSYKTRINISSGEMNKYLIVPKKILAYNTKILELVLCVVSKWDSIISSFNVPIPEIIIKFK